MTFSKMPLRPAAAGEHLVTPRSDRAPAAEAKSRPLFVKQRLPVRRHRAGRSGHRLLQRMTVRSVKLRAGEGLFCTIVVKPLLAGLEACDDRMTRSGVMFRCMLTWRGVATADVTAFGASAKMQPPAALSQTFDATCSARLGRRVDTVPLGLHRRLSEFCLFQFNAASKSFHDVCVNAPTIAVPHRPDTGNVGAQLIIHQHIPARVGGDTHPVEAKVMSIWPPTGRNQQMSSGNL